MTDQEQKDLQEFRELYAALSADGKVQANNMLNRRVFTILADRGDSDG